MSEVHLGFTRLLPLAGALFPAALFPWLLVGFRWPWPCPVIACPFPGLLAALLPLLFRYRHRRWQLATWLGCC